MKKAKFFYSHLVSFERVSVEIDSLDVTREEKEHLLSIAASNTHFVVLDTILSHLKTDDKERFLEHIEKDDHSKTWQFLKEKVGDIEEKIVAASEKLLQELHLDISKVKKGI